MLAEDRGAFADGAFMPMIIDSVRNAYNDAVFDTDVPRALSVVDNALACGVTPEEVIFDVVTPSLQTVMTTVTAAEEGSIAQDFMAAQIGVRVTDAMIAKLRVPPATVGKVIIGTAAGDIHSLGKRIVGAFLKARMVEVIDLGVSVPPARFVDEAIASGAPIIAISALMVHTARGEDGSIGVRRILRERGLEEQIRILVGGAPYMFDPALYRAVEADAWARNAIEASQLVIDMLGQAAPQEVATV